MRHTRIISGVKRTCKEVSFLLALLVYAIFGTQSQVDALSQAFMESNNAPYYGSTTSPCTPPRAGTSMEIADETKIAQTFIVGFDPSATQEISAAVGKYKLGGVFPVGGSDNSALTKAFFDELHTKAGVKLFIAADDEGGQVARFTKGVTPSAAAMGQLMMHEAEAKGLEAGEILLAAGLNGNLAPVLDISNPGTPWTAAERNWGVNADNVINKAGNYAKGLKTAGITPVYKHFPGIGKVTENTDLMKSTPQRLADMTEDLKPFRTLVNQNAGAVMLSNGYIQEWGDTPVGINPQAVQYLRDDVQFTGTIMTDALNALSQDGYGSSKVNLSTAIVASLNAGVDMPLFIPSIGSIDSAVDDAIQKVKAGVSKEKINSAYAKSLTLRGLSAEEAASGPVVTCCSEVANTTSVNLTGANNTEKVLSFLMNNEKYKFTLAQASGILGNFFVESGGTESNGNVPESSIQRGPNPAAQSPATERGCGYYGMAQWGDENAGCGPASRWSGPHGLKTFAESNGKEWSDLEIQLRFLVWELGVGEVWNGDAGGNNSAALDAIRNMTTVDVATAVEAGRTFEALYERCGCTIEKRKQASSSIFNYYADRTSLTTAPATPTAQQPSTSGGSAGQTVVALDAGHGAEVAQYTDSVTKLKDRETNNDDPPGTGETTDALDIANQVKAQLEEAGYKVVMLREDSSTPVSKRDRVNKAVTEKANIGVSIHSDAEGGLNQVWSQKVGAHRQNIVPLEEDDPGQVSFKNETTAKLSQQYADAFKVARDTAEGRNVGRDPDNSSQASSFDISREGLFSHGNIPLIMLWAEGTPWVYNEIARDNGRSLSADLKQKYITGIVNGVKTALPSTGAPSGLNGANCVNSAIGEGFAETVKKYVLPEYMGRGYVGRSKATPDYANAADAASREGRYLGAGGPNPVYVRTPTYADCGGFVTTLVVDSTHDPTYNTAETGGGGPTGTQRVWLERHWQPVFSSKGEIDVAQLQPGDVFIEQGHTFIFIGDVPGINSNIASASLNDRVPMAGKESIGGTKSDAMWFRKPTV